MSTAGDEAATRLALQDLVTRYCDAVARADLDAYRRCWTEDAVWRGPGLDHRGIDAITSAYASMRARFDTSLQALLGGTVTAAGKTASGWWLVRELTHRRDGSWGELVGRYDDRCRLTGGEWRFTSRTFTLLRRRSGPATT